MQKDLVCVAKITSAHGIRGAVKIKAFTQFADSLEEYAPLYSKDGKQEFDIEILSVKEDMLIVKIKGVNTRNEAENLKGRELYADKNLFPQLEEDEFYYDDLIGMGVIYEDGEEFGEVIAMHNYGGGDLIEIKPTGAQENALFPFTKEIFPEINIEDGTIVIIPPEFEFVGDNDN
ncbi:MAG: ribosome maturation factor RimM [Rickettsiaceae bacterium]|jgi:16S rRNA processing protein RimM|nr:ribosome maturation factor RimM [Rickettsiaceae bacterium]